MYSQLRTFIGSKLRPEWPLVFRFPDGRRRLGTVRIFTLTRLWLHDIPALREESEAVLANYHGGDVIDVGAFHGWYSVLLAGKAVTPATFVSVEPDGRALGPLKSNLKTIGRRYGHITPLLVEGGVGDGRRLEAVWPSGPTGHPSLTPVDGDEGLTIDQLVDRHRLAPTLVKIDVEGAEGFVVRGMRQTLTRHHPVILLELHREWLPAESPVEELEQALRDARYEQTLLTREGAIDRQLWKPPVSSDP